MTPESTNGSRLETALAHLIEAQALSQLQIAKAFERIAEVEQRVAGFEQRMAGFEQRMDEFDARLVRVEERLGRVEETLNMLVTLIQALPDAVKDRIGFRPPAEEPS